MIDMENDMILAYWKKTVKCFTGKWLTWKMIAWKMIDMEND